MPASPADRSASRTGVPVRRSSPTAVIATRESPEKRANPSPGRTIRRRVPGRRCRAPPRAACRRTRRENAARRNGRQSRVPRTDAAAKRMRGHVEPTPVEVEADLLRRLDGERLLRVDRKPAVQDVAARRTVGVAHLADEGHQRVPQRGEQPRHFGAGHAGFELVEQRVVRDARRFGEAGRLLALERDGLFQPREEVRELRLLAGFDPRLLCERRHARLLFDQPLRQFRRPVVVPTGFANVDGFGRGGVLDQLRSLEFGQQRADLGGGRPFVRESRHERRLLRAMLGPSGGHVRLLVPTQQIAARRKVGDAAETLHEAVVRRAGGSGWHAGWSAKGGNVAVRSDGGNTGTRTYRTRRSRGSGTERGGHTRHALARGAISNAREGSRFRAPRTRFTLRFRQLRGADGNLLVAKLVTLAGARNKTPWGGGTRDSEYDRRGVGTQEVVSKPSDGHIRVAPCRGSRASNRVLKLLLLTYPKTLCRLRGSRASAGS